MTIRVPMHLKQKAYENLPVVEAEGFLYTQWPRQELKLCPP